MLSFQLLGHVSLSKNGQPLARFRSQKEIALLLYLAHTGQSHPRELIAELLWSGRPPKQARSNLRTALTRLRRQVGPALLVTRKSLALVPEYVQCVDSARLLESLAGMGQINTPGDAEALKSALDSYHGDFLADFYLDDAPLFDEWMIATREQIRHEVVAAHHKLGEYHLACDDYDAAIDVARCWLQIDNLDEAAHALLIRGLLACGRMSAAVQHYDDYVVLLRDELEMAPSPVMTALIQDAQSGSPDHQQLPVLLRPPASALHNLPAVHDQFFGRTQAQQQIHKRMDQPWCRLVTLTGPGGVGKTRLSMTIARSRLGRYADGVWMVELADIEADDPDPAEAIAVEIATAMDLRLSGKETPREQVLGHLRDKQMLLLLDNFEHLIEGGTPLLLDMIQRCEGLQLLVTSRETVGLRAEWTIALQGLPYPTGDADEGHYPAVDLFLARQAQRLWQEPDASELAAIRAICGRVEGLPLAIELAAGLTPNLSPQEIAEQLEAGYHTLQTSLRDVPHRHRGLHIVFLMSWQALSTDLQQRLARLSIFRSGFTLSAAEQIAQADMQDLIDLCAKSMVSYDVATDRYRIHSVLRAYALENLPDNDPAIRKHAEFYLNLLMQHTEPLQKEDPNSSVVTIAPEIDNVRLAWSTGVNQRMVELLSRALTPLSVYYRLRGLANEAEPLMHNTLAAASSWGPEGVGLMIRAGLEAARFQIRLGRYRPALATLETTLRHASQGVDPWAEGMGHVLWGEALWRLGEYDAAQEKLDHAFDMANRLDDVVLIGWVHHHLGVIDDIQGRYASARDHLQQACAAWRSISNAQALSNSLNSIGLVYYHQNDLPAAQEAMEQALSLCNQIDDRHLQSLLLNNLSMMATEQGNYLGAQHYLQTGLRLAIASGNLTGQGEIYDSLGKNYLQQGDVDLAVTSLEQGLYISELIENRPTRAHLMINYADAKRKQGDLARAESSYLEALTIAQQDDLQFIACEALIGMAEILSKTDEKRAGAYGARAVELAQMLQISHLLERAQAIICYLRAVTDVHAESPSV